MLHMSSSPRLLFTKAFGSMVGRPGLAPRFHHKASSSQGKAPESQSSATVGSSSHASDAEAQIAEAKRVLLKAGFDPASFREQHIMWGDQDPFQHVNNVRYARFFEAARIQWMMSFGREWGGEAYAENMIRARGVSLILKSMEIQFRRPVTYPDTLLIGYTPLPSSSDNDGTSFEVKASAYSLSLRKFVTHSRETLVWYNYDTLRKCTPPEDLAQIVAARVHLGGNKVVS